MGHGATERWNFRDIEDGLIMAIPMHLVKVGVVLCPDDGFTCMSAGDLVVVAEDKFRPQDPYYVPCTHGRHYLSGQYQPPNEQCQVDHYVGFMYAGELK